MTTEVAELTAFRTWYEKAGVRTGPRRDVVVGEAAKEFFPSRLVPHLDHPIVRGAEPGIRRYLAAQHLYQWLHFTRYFEVEVVNRSVLHVANGTWLDLPTRVRLDALRIYVDEGYHSLYSLDVATRVEQWSGIPALPYEFEPFRRHLDAVGAGLPGYRALVELLQAVVFETLITSILADIPGDDSVLTIVRDTVREHAIDEGRHHAFFAALFRDLWAGLGRADRTLVADLLPQLIVWSLQPATRPARAALTEAGYAPATVAGILADAYDRRAVLDGIRFACRHTLDLFEDCGVLDVAGARDGFSREGLLAS